jgi:sugar lactone lactonase YvrE
MNRPHSKKMIVISFFTICLFTACNKGGSDPGSNSNGSTGSTGNTGTTGSTGSTGNTGSTGSTGNTNQSNTPPPVSTASYTVSLFAGYPQNGAIDGTGTSAGFKSPRAMTMDASGNLFVSDPIVNEIRKVTSAAVVTTIATSSNFNNVAAVITVDASGNIYIGENSLNKITAAGVISLLNLGIPNISGLTADASGNIYISGNNVIYKYTSAGVVSTLAGSGQSAVTDGTGTAASFSTISALAIDGTGNIYVADLNNGTCVIRKVTPAGVVTSITLTPAIHPVSNVAYSSAPIGGLALDGSGNIYATETQGNLIIEISPAGAVTTIAGTGLTSPNNGPATSAGFYFPIGIAVNSTGKLIYVADSDNMTIRKITTP